ncbi:hypothetical protein A9P82_06020 [Arachidicoccus ginsenosidimutans]|uniref:hypothetical protein n=1 Tax=Arachidicoccus sp. BS20 TaxID=1850526 RepID=UPI0007F05899|nr:hypothetical protein [Arachidicoccus sp. BS20]ANI88882.1 hypothetical protein A9P82_05990 [Arachidicoccus sp. BS20]ANI88888.1 hypothetical protein A9P82_06020 [Arachidicoccus sp. BS20]
MYDTSLKRKWDWEAALEYAWKEGYEEGLAIAKGEIEDKEKNEIVHKLEDKDKIVHKLITIGPADEEVAKYAGVSKYFVKKVRASLKKK